MCFLICHEKNIRALCPEIFCTYEVAIRKVLGLVPQLGWGKNYCPHSLLVFHASLAYGSVSPGREFWPKCVRFLKKVEPLCDQI